MTDVVTFGTIHYGHKDITLVETRCNVYHHHKYAGLIIERWNLEPHGAASTGSSTTYAFEPSKHLVDYCGFLKEEIIVLEGLSELSGHGIASAQLVVADMIVAGFEGPPHALGN